MKKLSVIICLCLMFAALLSNLLPVKLKGSTEAYSYANMEAIQDDNFGIKDKVFNEVSNNLIKGIVKEKDTSGGLKNKLLVTPKTAKSSSKNEKNTLKTTKNTQSTANNNKNTAVKTSGVSKDYYVVYDYVDDKNIVLIRGEKVSDGDEYISAENKKYVICEIDEKNKTAKAKFVEDVKLPVINVKRNAKKYVQKTEDKSSVNALSVYADSKNKKVGVYHTHNDECYNDEDGTDSIYGKGGIHDIGQQLVDNLKGLGIEVEYSQNLHLPHNSGAYTRSEVTASEILQKGDIDGIFDVHRDATPRSEYITTVNGEKMSKVRMVVGSANKNSAVSKEFALTIKAYADEVYPNLIKDIYIGKGYYNQHLSPRAMLFEMGTNTIEKDLVRKSTLPLAKTIDAVLYGVNNASEKTQDDVDMIATTDTSNGTNTTGETGTAQNVSNVGAVDAQKNSTATNYTLFIVLACVASALVVFFIFYGVSYRFRTTVNRFFSELFPFKKKTSGK